MKYAAVIGGGPAGLMAAETLASGGVCVTIYEQKPSLGRKFLMAGRGGLNLTHSEDMEKFMPRFGAAEQYMRNPIRKFSRTDLISWADSLGQETFTGSSGRVFPRAMKASPLLRAWIARLNALGVAFKLSHRWKGWEDGTLRFDTPDGNLMVKTGATILALGGASWPKLGSDGAWVNVLEKAGVSVSKLKPANCGFITEWTQYFIERYAGRPLKPVEITFGECRLRGELMITASGVEGGAIYALSAPIRDTIEARGETSIYLDLRPDRSVAALEAGLKAEARDKSSLGTQLRRNSGLSAAAIALLNEIAMRKGRKLVQFDAHEIATLIKALPLRLSGIASIDRAISSAGGVRFDAIDENFMLRSRAGVFVAGEMLDWEAPTGGYLLHGSFATGIAAGRGAIEWLSR